MALLIGGVYWATRGDDDTPAAGPASTATGTPGDTPTGTPTADQGSGPEFALVKAFYVGEGATGPRIFNETHKAATHGAPATVAAVNEAMAGKPVDADYRSYWPAGVTADQVAFDGVGDDGLIQIRVSDDSVAARPAGVTAAQATREVQAIVRTAQASFRSEAEVQFFVGTTPLDTVLGVAGPSFTGGADDDVLASMQITDLADGAKVAPGNLKVTGLAAAFEANVAWELLVGGDAAVDSGFATATECCTLSPYSFTIKNLQPGRYTLVVHDTDESGEGKPLNRDSKEIIVE